MEIKNLWNPQNATLLMANTMRGIQMTLLAVPGHKNSILISTPTSDSLTSGDNKKLKKKKKKTFFVVVYSLFLCFCLFSNSNAIVR